MTPRDTRDEVIEKLEKAHAELCAAVKRQWDGGHAFKLSIPARPEHDTDLIIGEAIRSALALLRAPETQERGGKPSEHDVIAFEAQTGDG